MCCYAKYLVVKLVILHTYLCIHGEIYSRFVLLHDSGKCYQMVVGSCCTVDMHGWCD